MATPGFGRSRLCLQLLAAFVTIWITLYTVYMGTQLPQIIFLLLGWGQSIEPETEIGFSFRRVFS